MSKIMSVEALRTIVSGTLFNVQRSTKSYQIGDVADKIVPIITADRQAFEEAIVEALEKDKRCNHKWSSTSYDCTICGIDEAFTLCDFDHNEALDQAIATVRAIYQGNNN